MGREVGGGIGMVKTCEPKALSVQCMTKFTTNKKKKEKVIVIIKYFQYVESFILDRSSRKFPIEVPVAQSVCARYLYRKFPIK